MAPQSIVARGLSQLLCVSMMFSALSHSAMDMDRVTWVCAHVTLPGLVKAVSKSTAASLIALITEIVQMVCKIFSAALIGTSL